MVCFTLPSLWNAVTEQHPSITHFFVFHNIFFKCAPSILALFWSACIKCKQFHCDKLKLQSVRFMTYRDSNRVLLHETHFLPMVLEEQETWAAWTDFPTWNQGHNISSEVGRCASYIVLTYSTIQICLNDVLFIKQNSRLVVCHIWVNGWYMDSLWKCYKLFKLINKYILKKIFISEINFCLSWHSTSKHQILHFIVVEITVQPCGRLVLPEHPLTLPGL